MFIHGLYRSRTGKVFGVCQGIANWRDLPVDILRAIVAVAILVTGIFPGVIIYALVALFLPLEPGYGTHYGDDDEKEERKSSAKNIGVNIPDPVQEKTFVRPSRI